MQTNIQQLLEKRTFNESEIVTLLSVKGEEMKMLLDKALETKLKFLDNNVHLRGLIEYSNKCRKNCLYCGLRKDNNAVDRYEMTDNQVFQCIELAQKLNYGSVALQCGERQDKHFTDKIEYLVKEIKRRSQGTIGITLSCGEQSEQTYRRWFNAGAHRYLLRIETANEELYYKIHPKDSVHSFKKRMECIDTLLKTGYQTGTGVMIGLPFQTTEDLARDILFFQQKDVAMVGMGPFIPHPDTPLWQYRDLIPSKEERMSMTLKMIAVLRLVMPEINMVSATANQTIDDLGREKAVVAGANVIMPNLSPQENREEYSIYPDKACVHDTPEQCYNCLDIRMHTVSHKILYKEWGDSVAFTKRKQQNETTIKQ
ncbi:MAG: [FeFe] hydrogenase H-cluster radical SAM maturase HydE [Bacteroidales bacterium]|nr:[FeFe] hydrogenase H-cluster radical SAM maturase HydE [Bacteroidales bacterium]